MELVLLVLCEMLCSGRGNKTDGCQPIDANGCHVRVRQIMCKFDGAAIKRAGAQWTWTKLVTRVVFKILRLSLRDCESQCYADTFVLRYR